MSSRHYGRALGPSTLYRRANITGQHSLNHKQGLTARPSQTHKPASGGSTVSRAGGRAMGANPWHQAASSDDKLCGLRITQATGQECPLRGGGHLKPVLGLLSPRGQSVPELSTLLCLRTVAGSLSSLLYCSGPSMLCSCSRLGANPSAMVLRGHVLQFCHPFHWAACGSSLWAAARWWAGHHATPSPVSCAGTKIKEPSPILGFHPELY